MPEKAEVIVTTEGINSFLNVIEMDSLAIEVYKQEVIKNLYDEICPKDVYIEALGNTSFKFTTHGKWIFLEDTVNKSYIPAVVHLGMSGGLVIRKQEEPKLNHHLANFTFYDKDGSDFQVDFVNPRGTYSTQLFVRLDMSKEQFLKSKKIGPDFYLDIGTKDTFVNIVQTASKRYKTKSIKELLLDQSVMAGIGNYLASEGLYHARIHPLSCGAQLQTLEMAERLGSMFLYLRNLVSNVIEMKGMSTQHYVNADGKAGTGKDLLKVYGKEGSKCGHCSDTIVNIPINNRSTFFCKTCQRHQT